MVHRCELRSCAAVVTLAGLGRCRLVLLLALGLFLLRLFLLRTLLLFSRLFCFAGRCRGRFTLCLLCKRICTRQVIAFFTNNSDGRVHWHILRACVGLNTTELALIFTVPELKAF